MKFWPVICSLFMLQVAQAQTINTHGFRFSDTLETVGMEDALGVSSELIQAKQPFVFRTSFDYAHDSLSAANIQNANLISFVDHLYSISMGVGALVNSRILLGFTVPLHFVQLSDTYVSGQFDSSAWQFGDMWVHAKLRLTSDKSKINVAFRPQLSIPTGSGQYFVSDNNFGVGGRFIADTTLGRWKWITHAGYSYSADARFLSIDHRNLIDAGIGLFYRINQRFGWNAEWLQSISIPDLENGQNPTQVNLALRYDTGTTKIFAGGGVQGFDFSNGSRPYMFFAGIKHPFGSKRLSESVPPVNAVVTPTEAVDSELAQDIEFLSSVVVYFANKSARIKPSHYESLNKAVTLMNRHEGKIQYLIIHGYADPRGDENYNKRLSERRARAVKNYFIQNGVNEHMILIDGYGEEEVKTTNEKDYHTSRRVDFQVIKN